MALHDKQGADDFDVVLVHDRTEDGDGARVLRARPGRLEAGEVRALQPGQPLTPGGQVVQLSPHGQFPNLYDVKVEYEVKGPQSPARTPSGGPAQVATPAYRASWDRTFGRTLN
ncbi:MAG: hypothetical protein ABSC94_09360 [Polyangiaceae bacterium]